MSLVPDVTRRRRQPEVMDRPDLDAASHVQALRGLRRLNFWSGSTGILWRPVRDLARQLGQPLRILDLATGAGDVPIGLWRRAERAGLRLQVEGCDVSPRAVDYARQQAERCRADVRFFQLDVGGDDLPTGYDVLVSSLFLHHLEEERAVDLLRRMGAAARRLVLINDLARSRAGLLLAHVATRLLSASPVVHYDGPRSVEGAFTPDEALALAGQAGLTGATVTRRWPARYLLTWRRA